MKKLLSIIAILSLLVSLPKITVAQDTSWGPMVGVNGSRISNLPYNSSKPGANIGLFLNHSKHEHLGLKVEAFYSQMGTSFENSSNEVQMHYVQVPVYAVWYFNDRGNDFRPKVMIGPYLGFLADASGSNASGGNLYKDNFNGIDVGGKAAAGFNWKLNPKMWLNTEFYYGGSFASTYKDKAIDLKNKNLGLNVGLSFPVR